jgi:hypothetical protein
LDKSLSDQLDLGPDMDDTSINTPAPPLTVRGDAHLGQVFYAPKRGEAVR